MSPSFGISLLNWGDAQAAYFQKELVVNIGKIKWFDLKKGFGFIVPDDGSEDVLIHISVLQKAEIHITEMLQNMNLSYEMIKTDKGFRALSVEEIKE